MGRYSEWYHIRVDKEHFKEFLRRKDLSVRRFCIENGFSETTVRGAYRAGTLTLSYALSICRIFDCGIREIFGEEQPEGVMEVVRYILT